MADIHQTFNEGATAGARIQRVIAVVRPASHVSVMPSPVAGNGGGTDFALLPAPVTV